MKLVAARCLSCGANIDVDAYSKTAKCEFCNSNIIVDDAINKLRLEIANLPTLENYLKNADRYYKNSEWDNAYKQYNKALELEPDNYVIILRNGISNALDSNYYEYSFKPLLNGVDEALKVLGNDASGECYNKIAYESFKATCIMENYAKKFYNIEYNFYKELIGIREKLLKCLNVYDKLLTIPCVDDIKKKILFNKIDFRFIIGK